MIMTNRDTLLIGDQRVFTVKTTVPKGAKLIVPKPDSMPSALEIVGIPSIDTLSINSNSSVLSASVKVTSFDSGSHFMPRLPILVVKPDGKADTLWYGGENLEYTTVKIDTASYKPYDVKGQVEYPVTFKEIAFWVGIALALTLLIYAIIRFIKRRRANKSFFEAPKVDEPPYLVALRDLEKIRSQKLWQNNKEKLYYTYITDVLRIYIESRFGITAMEYTTAEILQELSKKGLDVSMYSLLKELLSLADLVKFAKYKATAEENENAVPAAIRFVNGTYTDIEIKEKAE